MPSFFYFTQITITYNQMMCTKIKFRESDERLFGKFQHHDDRSALSRLFKRYGHQVLSLCHYYLRDKEDSEDALMDVFQKLLHLPSKQKIKDFKAWLFVVIRNYCISKLKKKKRDKAFLKEIEKINKIDMENNHFFSHIYEEQILLEELYSALEELADHQKICLRLFYNDELNYREIMKKTGYTFNQVKSYIQNGRENLKKFLITKEGGG